MKKVLTAVVVALFVSSAAFAEGKSANFVDANNDGKCDNIGQEKRDGSGKGEGKKGGKCKRNRGQNKGGNFVDANGDGTCDNVEQGKRKGSGQGKGKCNRQGKRKGKGNGKGQGRGQGRGCKR